MPPKGPGGTSRIALASATACLLLGGMAAAGAGAQEVPASTPSADTSAGAIRGADAPDAVEGEYIVVLKESGARAADAHQLRTPSAVHDLARALLRSADAEAAETERTFASALKGFTLTADRAQVRRLAADPAVAYVEQNRIERGDEGQQDPSWGLDRVDQRDLPLDGSYDYASTGTGVTAYIVDSGVRIGHEDFDGRASYGHDFVQGDAKAQDCNGHGTHVAGTVGGDTYGMAKDVDLVAVRVLNCENRGTTADVIAGYDWVARNAVQPAVANVSIGGDATDAKDAAVTGMVQAGVTVAVSAGNDDADACQQSPARAPAVLTVAATDDTDARWSGSNHGDCVDLFAPGADIRSAGIESDTASARKTGTSMATPHVTGAAAMYLAEHPEATPEEVAEALAAAASRDKVSKAGAGSPNALLYNRF